MCAVLSALSMLGRETARIVLHATCVVCGRELPWRARKASCCNSCWDQLPAIVTAKCNSCALPLGVGGWESEVGDALGVGSQESGVGEENAPPPDPQTPTPISCIRCLESPLPVEWTDAWGHYRGSLERLLHAFKFEHHDFLDDPLSALLEDVVRARGDLAFDAIVPVPMHRAKLRQRGYNQAELLARALGKRMRVRCEPALLRKRLDRLAQSTLPRSQRAKNVRGAFVASEEARDRSLLIVDDICTTAETLRACAETLVAAGAARVCAVVAAKA